MPPVNQFVSQDWRMIKHLIANLRDVFLQRSLRGNLDLLPLAIPFASTLSGRDERMVLV